MFANANICLPKFFNTEKLKVMEEAKDARENFNDVSNDSRTFSAVSIMKLISMKANSSAKAKD